MDTVTLASASLPSGSMFLCPLDDSDPKYFAVVRKLALFPWRTCISRLAECLEQGLHFGLKLSYWQLVYHPHVGVKLPHQQSNPRSSLKIGGWGQS